MYAQCDKPERAIGRTKLTTLAMVDVLQWKKDRKDGYVQSLGRISNGKYQHFRRYPYVLKLQLLGESNEAAKAKISSIHAAVSIERMLVRDRQTDRPGHYAALCRRAGNNVQSRVD